MEKIIRDAGDPPGKHLAQSLRRTAALVLGLMLTICWAESLAGLVRFPAITQVASSMLAPSGYTVPAGGD